MLLVPFHARANTGCDTGPPDINTSYTYAVLVFYGKFVGADTAQNYFDMYGRPYVVNNFEVDYFYKGPDGTYADKARKILPQGKFTLSLLYNCSFDSSLSLKNEAMYLVYVERNTDGHLFASPCGRTRIIHHKDFTVSGYFWDAGHDKNEHEELLKLQADPNANRWLEYQNQPDAVQLRLKEQLHEYEAYMTQQRRRLQYLSIALALMGAYGVFATIKWKQRK